MTRVYFSDLSPVVLFTYKRLSTTRMVVDSLALNAESSESDLIVFSDGPKGEKDANKVWEVREYLRTISYFKSVCIRERKKNLGLAESFIQGISEVLSVHDKAIFLEDDNVVSRHFLNYMNNALSLYENNDSVSCVSGYSWPLWPKWCMPYFLKGAETWSMATWSREWNQTQWDGKFLLNEIARLNLANKVDSYGQGYLQMLRDQVDGKNDSWGVRWWTNAFIRNKVCLYSHKPLVIIADPGDDSTHCTTWGPLFRKLHDLTDSPVILYPEIANENIVSALIFKSMAMSLRFRRVLASCLRRIVRLVGNY
jgi:hypothetical protein